MRIFSFLEKNKIATKETLEIFVGTAFLCCLSWLFIQKHFLLYHHQFYLFESFRVSIILLAKFLAVNPLELSTWLGLSLCVIGYGGMANLYVIDFNNFRMPVIVKNRREFKRIKKLNPSRRIVVLNQRTKLGWLCDRFWVGKSIYSVGDFMVLFGVGLAVLPFITGVFRLLP
jgi:hypothetical protein